MIILQFYTRNRNGCKCSYKRLEHKRAKKETESEAFISSHTNKTYLRGKKWKNECWYHMKNGKEKWECWGWENVRNIGILVLMNSVYAVIIIIAALICLISLSFTVKSLGAFFFCQHTLGWCKFTNMGHAPTYISSKLMLFIIYCYCHHCD